jgi:hypothetical protein
MEDAKRAGLSSNDSWRKYPRAMCRSRCTSEAARSVAPDIIMIGYTPDEIDPMQPVNIEDRMESIKVSSSAVEPIAIEQKNAGGYDPNNIKHKAALAKKLSEMNLSYLCDKVSIAMKGKNSKDLDNVVETVKLEDDLDFSLNLPFTPTASPMLTNGENVDTIVAEVKEEVKSDKQSVRDGISEETSRG